MISALFVESGGVYFNDERIDPWDIERDAFGYKGPNPVIAHPPCKRWGRYWSGGPSAKTSFLLGDDGNAFAYALWCVRTYGGVIEHPEASHAWKWFGLQKPSSLKQWVIADSFGFTCQVEQGHYGHPARKKTWLYAVNTSLPELIQGKSEGKARLDPGYHTKEEARAARSAPNYTPIKRISTKEMKATPVEFKELLISLVANS